MASQNEPLHSIFPDLPRASPAVDKEGNFTPLWSLGLASLFQALQVNYKNEGILFPPLKNDQALTISSLYVQYYFPTPMPLPPGVPDISGQTIYNTTIEKPQIFIINYDASPVPNVTAARWWTFAIT